MTARHISNLVVYHHSQYFAIMATSGYPAWVRTNPSVLYSLVPSYLAGTSPADDCSCRTIRIYLCQVWLLESRLGFLDFFWKSWMRSSKGSRFTLGVWGLRVCSLDVAQPSATVRNRPQPSATVCNRSQPFATVRAIPVWPCLWQVLQKGSFLEVSNVALLRFAWQAWHFVTFRCVL